MAILSYRIPGGFVNNIKKNRDRREWSFYIMLIPSLILVLIYSYGPMAGLIMAFQKFNPGMGFFKSPFVGFANFKYVFALPDFYNVMWNTVYIALIKICAFIIIPLILALLFNELRSKLFKNVIQSMIFIPFLLSWTVMGGIIQELFSLDGPVNIIIESIGYKKIFFMASNEWFRPLLVFTDLWKSQGYNMIIFLAAITNVNPSLYEAAEVDGAGKLRQAISITIPSILPMIILITTLSLGNILNAGFEQVLLLYNPLVYETGDILDTFVFRLGIYSAQYSPAAAVGLLKSIISCGLVSITYYLAYKINDYRIF